jgi:hypothetical protein
MQRAGVRDRESERAGRVSGRASMRVKVKE